MPWDDERLKALIEQKLKGYQFILVSNREPYMHVYRDGQVELIMPASGMAIALDSLMQAAGGTWVASGSGEADQEVVSGKDTIMVPPGHPKYKLRRLWLTREEEEGYYYGFANKALWPLCHIAFVRPQFSAAQWETYKAVNRKFANVILSEIKSERTIVLLQDYHFSLLPRMLRKAAPKLIISHFWHIPWPSYEVFRICPWGGEILQGLLGNDLLGFHLRYHCNNFFDTVERTLETRVDYEEFAVIRRGRKTRVWPFPISVDFERFASMAQSDYTYARMEELVHHLKLDGVKIGLGVDRLDYTKGIPERFEALDIFFRKYPKYQGKFTFIQIAPYSRIHIQEYRNLVATIDSLEVEVNARYSDRGWKPLILMKTHLSQQEIVPFYRLADVMVISALHDGMNLVTKEYVACRVDGNGALILSPFAGAARELSAAYCVNPYNPENIADAIFEALEASPEEKATRMETMRGRVREHNIYSWAAQFLESLAGLTG